MAKEQLANFNTSPNSRQHTGSVFPRMGPGRATGITQQDQGSQRFTVLFLESGASLRWGTRGHTRLKEALVETKRLLHIPHTTNVKPTSPHTSILAEFLKCSNSSPEKPLR